MGAQGPKADLAISVAAPATAPQNRPRRASCSARRRRTCPDTRRTRAVSSGWATNASVILPSCPLAEKRLAALSHLVLDASDDFLNQRVHVDRFGLTLEIQDHSMAQRRRGQRLEIVDADVESPLGQR